MEDRKFPIGRFVSQATYSPQEIEQVLSTLDAVPAQYRQLVACRSEDELAKTYREGSWTVRQLVHHVADIQLVHFLRMKKALTEPDYKSVTLIDMNAWATTADAAEGPIEDSLLVFEGILRRYTRLGRSLDEAQLAISYFHPVRQASFTQAQALALSAWHVQHHLAHIRLALQA